MSTQPSASGQSQGTVVVYPARGNEPEHEKQVHFELGRRIAQLLGMKFDGEYRPEHRYAGHLYFIPSDTLIGMEFARSLGITTEDDLFGGVASHAFIPTKAISHALLGPSAAAPDGWSPDFGRLVQDAVLRGFTSFNLDDAREAGRRLLEYGPLRIKPVHATAGRGQVLVPGPAELIQALAAINTDRLAECGVVLEEHLEDVKTYSVGQIRLAKLVASYVGTQHLTPDNKGEMVYGGSDLIVARGGFDALLKADLPPDFQTAIAKAQVYDQAASQCFAGFFASRRNYDVASGLDSEGKQHFGVLEQSWRTGGASSAEIAALEAFHAQAQTQFVRARTLEIFGQQSEPPSHAVETFHGEDKDLGLIRKYVMVEPYGN